MRRIPPFAFAGGLLLLAVALWVFWRNGRNHSGADAAPSAVTTRSKTAARHASPDTPTPALARAASPPAPTAATPLTAAEKAARIEKIRRDYDEIRAKASADYSAAGANFPGGLNAFLRQLALLEREKRADFARILSPRELEDLELRETPAGQLVQRLLGSTAATDEQRRAAFRLQRDFEDRFALTFDVSPAALLQREAARQQTQEKILATLGDELTTAWLSEGGDYAGFAAFVARHNLPPSASLDLWRVKNEFTLGRLELAAAGLTPEQRAAAMATLVQQIETRVGNIVGSGMLGTARNEVLLWLPKR